jgi:segregation and condensation protein B
VDEVQEAIIELMPDYAYRDNALEVVEMSQGYSLQLGPIFDSLIDDLIPAKLKKGTLRTLAAIALENPIVQTDLIEFRSSSAYQHVEELVILGFVRKHRYKNGQLY